MAEPWSTPNFISEDIWKEPIQRGITASIRELEYQNTIKLTEDGVGKFLRNATDSEGNGLVPPLGKMTLVGSIEQDGTILSQELEVTVAMAPDAVIYPDQTTIAKNGTAVIKVTLSGADNFEGTVRFYSNKVTPVKEYGVARVEGTTATLELSGLPVGSHFVAATYLPAPDAPCLGTTATVLGSWPVRYDAYISVENTKLPQDTPTSTPITQGGQLLSTSALSATFLDPDTGAVVPGILSWEDAGSTVVEKNRAYTWQFVPENSSAYVTATGALTPWRVHLTPQGTPTADAVVMPGVTLSQWPLQGAFTDPDSGAAVAGVLAWDGAGDWEISWGEALDWAFTPADS